MSEEKIPIEYYLTKNEEVIKFVRYDELDKYKQVIDKIKEIIKASDDCLINYDEMDKKIHKLLEEIE